MKKGLIIPLILIIGAVIITFALKPADKGRKIIKIDELNIENLDFAKIYSLAMGNRIIGRDTYIYEFTMTVIDNKKIISMNFSIMENGAFSKKRITGHLNSRKNELTVKTVRLEENDVFTIDKLIYSFSKMIKPKQNNITNHDRLFKDNFRYEELSNLIKYIKEPILDALKTNDKLHIYILSKNSYNIYGEADIYLINEVYDEVTDIKEINGDERFEIVREEEKIMEQRVKELRGIEILGHNDNYKYYFLDEN